MAKRTMSEETKAKIAATRAANKASGVTGGKKSSLEDKIAQLQAMADSGDVGAQSIMPAIETYKGQMEQAVVAKKQAAKRIRKLLSAML